MFDEALKQELLRRIPHGVYVCGCVSNDGSQRNAFTLTWITQSSFEPPVVTIAVRRDSASSQHIRASRVFSVNFLGNSQSDLALRYMQPASESGPKLTEGAYHDGVTGAPILNDAVGAIECNVIQFVEYGDHDVIVAEIIATEGKEQREPQLLLSDTPWSYGG